MIGKRQTVRLGVIANDQAPVILRCCGSVRPLVDHWLSVGTDSRDTGSDDPPAIIRTRLAVPTGCPR